MTLVYADDLVGSLPHGWDIRPFEELVFFQEGPGIRNWQYVDQGVPFVNIRCLVDGRLDRVAMSHVSTEEAVGKYQHFLLEADDYVVSSSGTLGRIATVQATDLPCMLNTSVIRMRPKTGRIDRGYLKYFLLSEYYQRQIESFATGSAQLNYGPMHLRQMFIISPPPAEQRAIAHILGALDDKIELNRRMNETLEALASGVMLSESSIVSTFGDIAENIRDVVHPGAIDSETPYIALDHMPRQSIALTEWGRADSASSAKARFRVDDILFGKLRPYFHKVGIAPCDGVSSTDILVIRPKAPEFHALAVAVASSRPFVAYATATSTGTKMPRASWRDLADYEFEAPEPQRMMELNNVVDPLLARIRANIRESRTLAALRDALLPKLISGELRIDPAPE